MLKNLPHITGAGSSGSGSGAQVCQQFPPLTSIPTRDTVSQGSCRVKGARAFSAYSSNLQKIKSKQGKWKQRRNAKAETRQSRRQQTDRQLGSESHRTHTGHPRNFKALV